jgi:hypothetical protein
VFSGASVFNPDGPSGKPVGEESPLSIASASSRPVVSEKNEIIGVFSLSKCYEVFFCYAFVYLKKIFLVPRSTPPQVYMFIVLKV